MKMKINMVTLVLLTVVLAMSGCTRDSEEEMMDDHTHSATIRTAFHFYFGTSAFDTSTVFQDDFGNSVRITTAKFYTSCTQAYNDTGEMIAEYPSVYMLVDATNASNNYELGVINEHHVHDLRYNIGIDSLTNHADMTTAPPPLNIPSMTWAWNSVAGYKFLVIEGKVNDGSGEVGFAYHCLRDPQRRWVTTLIHADVADGSTTTIDLKVDLEQVLSGVDVANNLDTHTDNNLPLAVQLMDNASMAITKL